MTFALDGTLDLRTSADGEWRGYTAVAIASGQSHQIDGGGNPVAILYLGSRAPGASFFSRITRGAGICPIPRFALRSLLPLLVQSWNRSDTAERVPEICLRLRETLIPQRPADAPEESAAHDARTVSPLSDVVGLSRDEVARLFRLRDDQELWIRLVDALRLLGAGSGLSFAAREAGFGSRDDLLHAVRTIFGIDLDDLTAELSPPRLRETRFPGFPSASAGD
jgi:hypothetical protein